MGATERARGVASPSNSVIRLGGLCFTGPDRGNFAAAFGLLLILSFAYLASTYDCTYILSPCLIVFISLCLAISSYHCRLPPSRSAEV